MSIGQNHQALPRAGPEREALREKGQFWTPDWVAEAMVAYCLGSGAPHVFDPAVGAGAFFRAAKAVAGRLGRTVKLVGTELHARALDDARAQGLSDADLDGVTITDFIVRPPRGPFRAIVANPPYIRHHRLPPELKTHLKALATRLVGRPLDGRAGLHVFFLIRALELLAPAGRLAFIVPADTAEGVFARPLWAWIARHYRLDGVVTFDHAATPFPGVDTNALVLLISRNPPLESFTWARCTERGDSLCAWITSGFVVRGAAIESQTRPLEEALRTGLSREPQQESDELPTLLDYACVLRGIATGANDFFFLTESQAAALRIPREFLAPAVGRTRDVVGNSVTHERLSELAAAGRPTLLFKPDGRGLESFPAPVREYLRKGVELGLPARTLIASRRPWYKMESRSVPPFLFAYLGRRSARFIRNEAGVVPLTGFLCVYPRSKDPDAVQRLWHTLSHPDTVANLKLVGKSYGSGAIKVEPRALERLPIARSAIIDAGLGQPVREVQLAAL